MDNNEKKWNIELESIQDEDLSTKMRSMYRRAKAQMEQRTRLHSFFSKVSHMQNLYESNNKTFSEGSTQAIKRKIRAETIQRIPDGEIKTPFDKNSIEQAQIEFIFKNKVMRSEFDGRDRLKDLWRTFNASYDYGFACVRTGFEKDCDGDIRTTFKLIQWNDILPAPDCDFIEDANWYIIREYVSLSTLKSLLNEKGKLKDPTYNEKVVKYLIDNEHHDAQDGNSVPLADKKNHAPKTESIKVWTLYKRGCSDFKTFVPSINAVLRITKNYDPRKDVPLHFCILEPDPDFPLGCSSIMWTLSQQQFADAFQTTAYQTLLLAANPPLIAYGNLANARLRMKPRAMWMMGTNPNNKVDKFPIETTTVTQYGSILNNVSANMMKNLNVTESNVATDSQTMGYSGTPQGVEQQKRDKSTTVNQYQKRMEIFFSEWANHALRSYLNAMSGVQMMTVDEDTRRKIWSVEQALSEKDDKGDPIVDSIIDGNKIKIDFDALKEGVFEFEVRSGSLIQGEREEELQNIQQLLVPVSQMLGNVGEQNREAFETVIMQLIQRMCEISDIDVAAETSAKVKEQIVMDAMKTTMQTVMNQQGQINQLQEQMGKGMPQMPSERPQMPPEASNIQPPMPMPSSGQKLPPSPLGGGGPLPSLEGDRNSVDTSEPGVSAEFPPVPGGLPQS